MGWDILLHFLALLCALIAVLVTRLSSTSKWESVVIMVAIIVLGIENFNNSAIESIYQKQL